MMHTWKYGSEVTQDAQQPNHPHYQPHPSPSIYHYPIPLTGPKEYGDTAVSHSTEKTTIHLDVHHFNPEEVHVRSDGIVILAEGHHEEKEGQDGLVIRDFHRKYSLPSDATVEDVSCEIDSFGILEIKVPRRGSKTEELEKEFPVAYSPPKETFI